MAPMTVESHGPLQIMTYFSTKINKLIKKCAHTDPHIDLYHPTHTYTSCTYPHTDTHVHARTHARRHTYISAHT